MMNILKSILKTFILTLLVGAGLNATASNIDLSIENCATTIEMQEAEMTPWIYCVDVTITAEDADNNSCEGTWTVCVGSGGITISGAYQPEVAEEMLEARFDVGPNTLVLDVTDFLEEYPNALVDNTINIVKPVEMKKAGTLYPGKYPVKDGYMIAPVRR